MITNLQKEFWTQLTRMHDRLPHAMLIHGAAGVGKLALAERFAQLLLCEHPGQGAKPGQGANPCGGCEGCRWFLAGNHPDVRIVEPEALALVRPAAVVEESKEEQAKEKKKPSLQIKIEQTRGLADFLNLASHRGGRRVAIIHPAEDMNTATANALLKSLEEPPLGAFFLLVSHHPARLLPTIRSRCISLPVPLPDPGASVAWLTEQGVRSPQRWLAFAGGSPLRALDYATGERGEAIERVLRGIASGNHATLGEIKDRDQLEPLAEVLQKAALDRAFAALSGRTKYGAAVVPGDAHAWLSYARTMGRHRALTHHPLSPKLFAAEMLAGMPKN
ncbi:MAG: DNA polymerase III subunit delta' [Betaproteobacteria bacterium]|nr:DNA polymerase III subunit delta' [Betaproteobacteria bacterium]MSQ88998.1 DNA polymerase III subunit delta' [Betaproteobacteria bacterium]